MAIASVTGEVLGTPNAKMKEQLGKGGLKLFTPRRSTSRLPPLLHVEIYLECTLRRLSHRM